MRFLSDILAKAGLVVDGVVTLNSVANATTDTDKFLTIEAGVVKYRTGSQLLSDIGGLSGSGTADYVVRWTSASEVGVGVIRDNGTNVGIGGAPNASYKLAVAGNIYSSATGNAINLVSGARIYFANREVTIGDTSSGSYENIVIGYGNTATGAGGSILLGKNNNDGGFTNNFVVHTGNTITLTSSHTVNILALNTSGVGIGNAANTGGAVNSTEIAIGSFTVASGAGVEGNIAIGRQATATGAYAIAMGAFAEAAAGEFVVGSRTKAVTSVYFGSGNQSLSRGNGAGASYTIHGSAALGTDQNGGNITIAGGRGTGSGTAGVVIISTPGPGTTGTALQTLIERARFSTVGMTLSTLIAATTDTDRFLVSDAGVIKYRTGAEMLSDIGAAAVASTLPVGGTAGQILAKIDGTNYNTTWIDNYTSSVKHLVKLAEAMSAGTAVYVSGGTGNAGTNMYVSKASNATEATSSKTMGIIATGGVTNDEVFVVTEGLLTGLNTSTAQIADPIWLGPNGTLLFGLANKPYAPNHLVYLGVVTRVHATNGEIFVKVQNGFELDELHDVQITSAADKHIIYRDAATSLWKNASLSVVAPSVLQSDYDANIVGNRNSVNKTFTLSSNFVAGTTRVFVNGIRYTPGASYDYVEQGTNQITFTIPPDLGDLLVVDYIKA